jgi:hypothetical protein
MKQTNYIKQLFLNEMANSVKRSSLSVVHLQIFDKHKCWNRKKNAVEKWVTVCYNPK